MSSVRLSLFAINVTLPALAERSPVAYAYLLHSIDAGIDLEQSLVPSNLDGIQAAALEYAERVECDDSACGVYGPEAIARLQSSVLRASGYDTGDGEDSYEVAVQSLVEQDGENPQAPSRS